MLFKKIIFIVIIFSFSVVAIFYMYKSYNPLARYNYDNKEQNEKIISKLNDTDLDYIVTYQIDPYQFYNYIDANNFSIYHIDQYNKLIPSLYDLSLEQQVDFVEEMIKANAKIDNVVEYLNSYSYTDLIYWYKYGDTYNSGAYLIKNPNYFDAYLDDNRSISIKEPVNLKTVGTLGIDLVQEPADQLISMCKVLDLDLKSSECGGLSFQYGYITYNMQKSIYENALSNDPSSAILTTDLPGHSENQLGIAFDLLESDDLYESEAYQWLVTNSYKFGYIQTLTEKTEIDTNKVARLNHFRYVGLDISVLVHDTGISFKEASNG